MFASIRRHQKWLMIVIVVLVIGSFVYYLGPTTGGRSRGRGGYGGADHMGSINGRPLTHEEFMQAYQEVRLEARMFSGRWPEEDPSTRQLFNPDARVQQRLVLLEKTRDLNIEVDDKAVATWIATFFRDPRSGAFRPDNYQEFTKRVLAPQGVTEGDLQRYIRRQVAIDHLRRIGEMSGSLVTRGDAEAEFRRQNEQMTAQVVSFNSSNYLSNAAVPETALTQFYTNNLSRYRTPDRLQVSYVRYDATNFQAQADQFLAMQTNLMTALQMEYQRRGPDTFKDSAGNLLSQEAAIAKIKSEERNKLCLIEANKQATTFSQQLFELYDKQPAQTNNLERVAAALGIQASVSEPFSRSEAPLGLKVPEEFADVAFSLTAEQPMSAKPIIGDDAVFVIALRRMLPSEYPPLAQIRDRVLADYRKREALDAARRAGEVFYGAVTNGLAQHKTFEVICAEAKVQPAVLPTFSLSTRSLQGWDMRVDLSLIKDTVSTLTPGGVSDFVSTSEGGMVVQLMSKQPADDALVKAGLPDFTAQVRARMERQALNEWFRQLEKSTTLSGLPRISRSPAETN